MNLLKFWEVHARWLSQWFSQLWHLLNLVIQRCRIPALRRINWAPSSGHAVRRSSQWHLCSVGPGVGTWYLRKTTHLLEKPQAKIRSDTRGQSNQENRPSLATEEQVKRPLNLKYRRTKQLGVTWDSQKLTQERGRGPGLESGCLI